MNPLLKHRTLTAAILDQLRKAILDGTYPAGAQLRQDALAATFKVSRIPIREALFQLDAEGLVRFVPQKGAVVAALSAEEIDDVFELRRLLEPRLLARSIPALDSDDFTRLDALHAEMVTATAANDLGRWGQINADFHMALYARAGLPRSLTIVHGLLQTSDRYTRVHLSDVAGMGIVGMQRAVSEHATLAALSRAGASAAACAFLDQHIRTVHDDLLRELERSQREAMT
ncbi:GntR family transcriptional regulator [Ancylobacter aquaticus]|uniref:GntR family transcriptional regulator n=1 Tax=Ancylobacter aquaticus TaxID=100 RepID=A0A4R1IBY5_ANCAQ|nr:GntR family transcriptional regulator [Ancylobacter aquaticus]TCK30649.1 GntR family transcriptional regulator [Ancylobacter aquaticus]